MCNKFYYLKFNRNAQLIQGSLLSEAEVKSAVYSIGDWLVFS